MDEFEIKALAHDLADALSKQQILTDQTTYSPKQDQSIAHSYAAKQKVA